jgi:hypothetical protein
MKSERDPNPDAGVDTDADADLVDADAEPDFASEHRDLTVGDGERGGPEGIPESESPDGYGGADLPGDRSRIRST